VYGFDTFYTCFVFGFLGVYVIVTQNGTCEVGELKAVKYDQLQRYKLLETIVYWEGELSTKHLCEYFGIQRQQASRDIQTYIKSFAPSNLEYDASKRRYVATENFTACFIDSDIRSYLQLISQHKDGCLFVGKKAVTEVSLEYQQLNSELFKRLLYACTKKRNVTIDYRTLEKPEKTESVISPHTIFFLDGQWLLRAFCFTTNSFRNFNLTLFFATPMLMDSTTYVAKETDDGWNTTANINVTPDPRLTAVQKRIVEKEFSMDYGSLLINAKVCLIPMILNELGIDVNVYQPDPLSQKIIVENLNAIKRWVF
jgi:predicted DNA-binding transcriptional regulator YafY